MASDASAAGLLSQEAIFTHCAALFRRIDADGQLPKPVRTLLKQLQLPYTKYAITGRADFLVQPEHPARLLLELLVEMARALPADGGLEALPAYWNLVDVIDQIRARKAPTDKDFQDAYCLLLALR